MQRGNECGTKQLCPKLDDPTIASSFQRGIFRSRSKSRESIDYASNHAVRTTSGRRAGNFRFDESQGAALRRIGRSAPG
jgi:hypothetical protein